MQRSTLFHITKIYYSFILIFQNLKELHSTAAVSALLSFLYMLSCIGLYTIVSPLFLASTVIPHLFYNRKCLFGTGWSTE